ncbi:hypothetical protein [Halomarina oriensis]|uniref:DUF7979 domain-containing protein n=1 Tax=Halomarina oriensis TaxID=671145 RepID=A0A6B0GHJ0_9EURY|nr:hypothetical protein [Halomarina oriensis]MWG34070.1 hypothetical protein [Halomarina oriensis]
MSPSRRAVVRHAVGVLSLATLAGCTNDDTPATRSSSGPPTSAVPTDTETTRPPTTVLTETPVVAYDDLTASERSTFDRALAAGGRVESYHPVGRFDERTLVRHEGTVSVAVSRDSGRNEAEYRLTAAPSSSTPDDEPVPFEDLSAEARTAVEAAIDDEYVTETMPNVSSDLVVYESETYTLSVTVADRRLWVLTVRPVE